MNKDDIKDGGIYKIKHNAIIGQDITEKDYFMNVTTENMASTFRKVSWLREHWEAESISTVDLPANILEPAPAPRTLH